MIFSMKTEYALRALSEISREEDKNPVNRKIISKKHNVPIHFLEQILLALKKAGLVKSVKGPGGGYKLSKSIDKITLWDIYAAVDEKKMKGKKCFPGMYKECEFFYTCSLNNVWTELNDRIYEFMTNMTLNKVITKKA